MDLKLSGKVAIITGGSAGIGFACAKTLNQEGVHVVITARDPERLEKAVASLTQDDKQTQVIAITGDMSKAADITKVVETTISQFGRVDILVNNAGAAPAGAFLTLPDEAFLEAWTLKLLGYIRMVRAVAPTMMQQKDGRIVNIIGAAARTPNATFLAGSTANAALLNFTRGISKELAQHNIRINAISPGSTTTARVERLAEQHATARGVTVEEMKQEMAQSIPLRRMADPAEIAAMTALLVSDLAASITGAEILIDGGSTPGI